MRQIAWWLVKYQLQAICMESRGILTIRIKQHCQLSQVHNSDRGSAMVSWQLLIDGVVSKFRTQIQTDSVFGHSGANSCHNRYGV